jgi:hypothetical protein
MANFDEVFAFVAGMQQRTSSDWSKDLLAHRRAKSASLRNTGKSLIEVIVPLQGGEVLSGMSGICIPCNPPTFGRACEANGETGEKP